MYQNSQITQQNHILFCSLHGIIKLFEPPFGVFSRETILQMEEF